MTWPTKSRTRARRERRRRRLPWAMAAFIVGLGAAIYYSGMYAVQAAEFSVKTIRVAGADRLTDLEVIALSGITRADNLFLLDEEEAAARIEANPYVRDCKVTRVFPDVVVIEVDERGPSATLMVDNRYFYAVDGEGVVLREVRLWEDHPGPLITETPDIGVVEVGQKLDSPALLEALRVYDAFLRTSMAAEVVVSEIAARSSVDVRMYCNELPFEIRWGRGDCERQARRLDILWSHHNGALDFEAYCDLRFGKNIACK